MEFKRIYRELEYKETQLENVLEDGSNCQRNLQIVQKIINELNSTTYSDVVSNECELRKYHEKLLRDSNKAHAGIGKSYSDGVNFDRDCKKILESISQTLKEFEGFAISAIQFDNSCTRIQTALSKANELLVEVGKFLRGGNDLLNLTTFHRINASVKRNVTLLGIQQETLRDNIYE